MFAHQTTFSGDIAAEWCDRVRAPYHISAERMPMMDASHYGLLPIFVVSLILILGASEIGRRLGVRAVDQGGDNVSTLEGAILGRLALMIGFTSAMALSRFEGRRDGVLNEANAIGTTALRARLLHAPHAAETLKLLREYVQVRLDITRRLPSAAELDAAVARSNALQEALWKQAKAVSMKDNAMVPTGLFIQTLNEMIDSHEKRLTALRNRSQAFRNLNKIAEQYLQGQVFEPENKRSSPMIPAVKAKLLEGKKGLIIGIANESSIAWGCAKAFRAFGAELAVTYLNDKAKKFVEPLARELEASIMLPLDVRTPGQMEAVFERITKDWGKLDFAVHSPRA
jgi:Enoyl-(Acyl carrier protein) reductase